MCSWRLRVFPYPTEVAGLAMIGNEYAGLRWRDVISDVCAEFVPYEIEWVGISDLWRVDVEFVGSLACCLTPYGSFWRLNVSVECLFNTNEVLAGTIDDVGSKELCRDLDHTAVLSSMFEIE